MKYIEVVMEKGSADAVAAIAEKVEAFDFYVGSTGKSGMRLMRLLVADDKIQSVLDSLQKIMSSQQAARVAVLPVEIVLPMPSEMERKEEDAAVEAREAIYAEVEKNSRLDLNFAVLVVLSTIVAAIGLIESDAAVVIGAMVIAPLLGPNIAFGLGTALGDFPLMRKSALTTLVGVMLAVVLSVVIGNVWPFDVNSPELAARSSVGLDSVALALASGAAAALSLTTGLSSVLVGVMVAVALLPPAVTLGLMLGFGDFNLALGAGLLLAINVVCVNLAIKVVFFLKGIRPRTWWDKKIAKRAMVIYILIWFVTLIILIGLIYIRNIHL